MSRRSGRTRTDDDDDSFKPPAIPRGHDARNRPAAGSRNAGSPHRGSNSNSTRAPEVVPDTVASARTSPPRQHQQNDLLAEKMQNYPWESRPSGAAAATTPPRPTSRVAGYSDSNRSPGGASRGPFAETVPTSSPARAGLHQDSNVMLAEKRQQASPGGAAVIPGAVAVGPSGASHQQVQSSPSRRISQQTDEGIPALQVPNRQSGVAYASATANYLSDDMQEEQKMEEDYYYRHEENKEKSSNFAPVVSVKSNNDGDKKQKPQLVERIRGPNAPPSDDDMVPDSPPISFSASPELAVAAEVVADEQDVEAQVQARVYEEREEIAAQVQKRLMDQAVHADVMTAEELNENKFPFSKRCMILSGLLAVMVIVVVVVVVVVVVGKNGGDSSPASNTANAFPTSSPTTTETPTFSPTPEPKCNFCHDGSVPEGLDQIEYTLGQDGDTCADFMERQVQLDQSNPACATGQAFAWFACSCPTLPPFPEDATCTICLDGELPLEPETPVIENRTCSDWNNFIAHIGLNGLLQCADLRDLVDFCECESDPTFVEFLKDLLLPVSGDALLQEGTPQNQALSWLAEQDPAGLTQVEVVQIYVLAVFYFSTNGPSWEEQYGFRSAGSVCTWNEGGTKGVICTDDGDVTNIKLDSNKLDGSIPSELATLTGLQMIELRKNDLVGSIPANIGDLSVLRRFDVDLNEMNGALPASLFDIPTLKELWLDQNRFSGPLPFTFGNAPLEWFTCKSCDLTGTIPETISGLSNLRLLDLDANGFTGSVPTFSGNTRLEELYLNENKLNGTLPATLGGLSRLELFAINTNFLSGTIAPSIGSLRSLTGIDLHGNFLVGDVPPFTGPQISLLFLYNNMLDGSLDEFFNSSSSSLTKIRLDDNSISGSIPESVGNFTLVEDFNLSGNQMSGSLPASLGNLNKAELVLLHTSGLTGAIPTELGRMASVISLTLGGNDLSGTVPSELGSLSALTELTLASCGLMGIFPSSVARLPNLDFLSINGNSFTNDVNETFCTRENPIDTFYSDCQDEAVNCPCCSHCCNSFGNNCILQ